MYYFNNRYYIRANFTTFLLSLVLMNYSMIRSMSIFFCSLHILKHYWLYNFYPLLALLKRKESKPGSIAVCSNPSKNESWKISEIHQNCMLELDHTTSGWRQSRVEILNCFVPSPLLLVLRKEASKV